MAPELTDINYINKHIAGLNQYLEELPGRHFYEDGKRELCKKTTESLLVFWEEQKALIEQKVINL